MKSWHKKIRGILYSKKFWYHCIAGFSGALCFDPTYLMLYNMMWTSMPPMTIGIPYQDAADSLLLSNPKLYKQGHLGIKNHLKYFEHKYLLL